MSDPATLRANGLQLLDSIRDQMAAFRSDGILPGALVIDLGEQQHAAIVAAILWPGPAMPAEFRASPETPPAISTLFGCPVKRVLGNACLVHVWHCPNQTPACVSLEWHRTHACFRTMASLPLATDARCKQLRRERDEARRDVDRYHDALVELVTAIGRAGMGVSVGQPYARAVEMLYGPDILADDS